MSLNAIGQAGSAAAHVLGAVGGVLDELFTSEEEKRKAAIAMAQLEQAPQIKNLEIDRQEAAHPSVFVAGARPAFKWSVVLAIFYETFLRPLLTWFASIYASWYGLEIPPPPSIGIEELIALAATGTGIYAVRGYERIRGTARNTLGGSHE